MLGDNKIIICNSINLVIIINDIFLIYNGFMGLGAMPDTA